MRLRLALARITTIVVAVFAAALVAVSVWLFAMWREHVTPVSLPEPTGAFAVGRTQFAWANPGGEELAVWAWYPAARSNRDASADYLPPPWRQALRDHQAMLMRSFFKHDPQVVRTHSRSGAVLASDLPAYPLVILRAGGNALTTDFTTLAEDLASHGYIVVGFDAPQRSFVIVQSRGRAIGCRSRGCMRRSAPQIIFRSAIKAC